MNTKEELKTTIETLKDEIQKHYEKIESLKNEKAKAEKEYSDIIYKERTADLRKMVGNYYKLVETYYGFGTSNILVSRYFYVKRILSERSLSVEKNEVWTTIPTGEIVKTMYDKDTVLWRDDSYMEEDAKKQFGRPYSSNTVEFQKATQIARETFEMKAQSNRQSGC